MSSCSRCGAAAMLQSTLQRCTAPLLAAAEVTSGLDSAGDAAAFAEQVAPLRAAAPPATRFVLVTATLPAGLYDQLAAGFPGIVPALGPGLHCSAPGACAADAVLFHNAASALPL